MTAPAPPAPTYLPRLPALPHRLPRPAPRPADDPAPAAIHTKMYGQPPVVAPQALASAVWSIDAELSEAAP
jgi:hypothetical protein